MVRNLEAVKARLARIPDRVKRAVAAQLDGEVQNVVRAIKAVTPVLAPEEARAAGVEPGALRDSVRAYRNPSRDLSWRIIEDARDEHGHVIAKNVEFGHRTAGGGHVNARPHFFPTWRAQKRGLKRRLRAVSKRAFKEEFPGG